MRDLKKSHIKKNLKFMLENIFKINLSFLKLYICVWKRKKNNI